MEHQENWHLQISMADQKQTAPLGVSAHMPQVMESHVHTWNPDSLLSPMPHASGDPASVDGFDSSPEVTTWNPQPQRVFPYAAFEGQLTPRSPQSHSDDRGFELQELLRRKSALEGGTDILVDNRPLSSLSTCAGATPGPASSGPTPTPEEAFGRFPWEDALASQQAAGAVADAIGPTPDAHEKDPVAAASLSRKVFVGGVPQDFTQSDMFTVFDEYGKVKKAWLQKCRQGASPAGRPARNHRGFGFVIFRDDASIVKLLGDSYSRFITTSSGAKLEVKRALSSHALQGSSPGPNQDTKSQGSKGSAPAGKGSVRQTPQAGPGNVESLYTVPACASSSVLPSAVAVGSLMMQPAAQLVPQDFRSLSSTPPPYNYVAMQPQHACCPSSPVPPVQDAATYVGVPQRVPSPVLQLQGHGGLQMPVPMQFMPNAPVPVMPGGMMAAAAPLPTMGQPSAVATAHLQPAQVGAPRVQLAPSMPMQHQQQQRPLTPQPLQQPLQLQHQMQQQLLQPQRSTQQQVCINLLGDTMRQPGTASASWTTSCPRHRTGSDDGSEF